MKKIFVLFLVLVMTAGSAMAIVVPDSSFEDAGAANPGSWDYIPNQFAAGNTAWNGHPWSSGGTPWVANNYVPVGTGRTGPSWVDLNAGYIYQSLADTYVEGETYMLSAWLTTTSSGQGTYLYFTDGTGNDGWGTTLAVQYYDVAVEANLQTWTQYSYSYTATAADAGKNIGIAIYGRGDTYLDDVAVTTTGATTSAPATETILIQPAPGPSGTLRNDFTGNLGLRFRVDQEVSIDKLAFYDDGSDGLTASHTIRIYESNDDGATGAVIAEATVLAGTGAVLSDGFRWVGLALPVTLYPQTGTDWYVLAATTANGDGDFWYTQGATGFTYNSYMDAAAGWQACWVANPAAFPGLDSPATDTTYYAYNMAATTVIDTSGDTITNGLVGYWPMDDGSGSTAADISGGSDGSISGATWTTGKYGSGLNFDGTNDFVSCGSGSTLRPSTTLSVSAWVRPDRFAYYEGIAGTIHDTGSTESGYLIMTNTSSRFGAGACGSGDSTITYLNAGTYSAGSWYHVMLTNDGSTSRLYVNGTQVTSVGESTPMDYTPASVFEIGRYSDDNETHYFDGIIDEVAVWDRALTQMEVTYLYNGGRIPAIMVTETLGGTEVDEGGATDSYDIVLQSSPTSNVLVTVTPGDSQIDIGAGAGVARVLTFTADPGGDWASPQTIIVTADDDVIYEPADDPHYTTTTHSASGGGYDSVIISEVVVSVADNDLGCGSWGYLPQDLDFNCYVDVLDLNLFALEWLSVEY